MRFFQISNNVVLYFFPKILEKKKERKKENSKLYATALCVRNSNDKVSLCVSDSNKLLSFFL